MDPVALTIGVSCITIGIITIALAVPLVRGRVGRNGFYGVRFPQSFQSDEAWFAINRFGGRRLILWSIPMIGLGVAAFFISLQPRPILAMALTAASLVLILIPVIESWRFARRYQRQA
jgi:uncharacterized membrane protein